MFSIVVFFTGNLSYRRGSDGIILGPDDFKRGSIYSDYYPTNPPPRPPSSKRSSINGHVNPGLTLREEIVTMNPLFEGQIVEHKDLDPLNCSDFAVHPDEIVLDDQKNPEGMHLCYFCTLRNTVRSVHSCFLFSHDVLAVMWKS